MSSGLFVELDCRRLTIQEYLALIPVMVNGIRTNKGLNKGCGSEFCVGSRIRQTPEEGRRTYWAKHFEYNNKDEDNSPKTLMIKIHIAVQAGPT